MREPLILPAVALAAGIAAARFVPFTAAEILVHGGALLLLAVAARRAAAPALARACLLLALFFGGALTELLHRPGPQPLLDARPREIVTLSGCVVEPPLFCEDREQFVLELAPKARARVSLYLREGERPPELRYGQRVEVEARIRRPRNFGNPGSFDYEGYLARRSIYWTASAAAGASVRVLGDDCGTAFYRALFGLRSGILARLERLYRGKPYETAMMQAVLVGEKSKVEKVWTEHFRSTGTYHALVISGLHLTVLAGVVLFLLRVFAAGQGTALVVAAAFSWLYALVTGWQPPVIRAATCLTLYLAARYFYRRHRLLNLVAAAAIAFLLLDPHQLFEASFQLSFLAVTAIAALAIPLLEKTSLPLAGGLAGLGDRDRDLHLPPRVAQFRIELRLIAETVTLMTRLGERWVLACLAGASRLFLYAFDLVTVSAAVQIGMALPMALYFHRVSISGLSANVLVVPLTSLLVPAGFLATATGWSVPAQAAGWLLWMTRSVVEWHARWEPWWRVPDPPLWLSLCFSASLVWLAAAARRKLRWRAAPAALAGSLLALIVWHPFPPEAQPGMLELTAIDVGQGDSLLVAFPDGKLALVDAGGIPRFAGRRPVRLDVGEDVISPYLWSRSIRRLDAVVVSHAHEDHIGGLAAIVDNFRPRELWAGSEPEIPAWSRLRERAARRGVTVRRVESGQRFEYGNAHVEILSPPAELTARDEARDEDSLVMRLTYGARSVLLTGDADRRAEQALAECNLLSRTDVLKVAHHGSNTSTGERFVEAVRPVFAVVSCGFENSYGHPHHSVVERLERRRSTLLRTDLFGMVSIVTDGGRRLDVSTARWSGKPRRLFQVF